MKRVEWQKLKAESKREIVSKKGVNASCGLPFLYQFNGAINNSKAISSQISIKNGNYPSSSGVQTLKVGNDITTGYRFTLTNLMSLYEEVLSDNQVMAICKRLNPNVEVPEVVDLIQQINDMLESDVTERTVTINESELTSDLLSNGKETCKVMMNGELAGCDFKWEFSPTRADPIKFYDTITEPTVGCLTLLLRNQSRLVQLLEAKDQEIQDYTLNGAVLSRKSLQTTIFDPKKEALITPSSSSGLEILDGLELPEYSEALDIFRKSERPKDVFIAPGPPTMSKTDLDINKANSSLSTGTTMRKRGHLAASSAASVMKGPKPMQASQRQSQIISEEKSQETPEMVQQDNSNLPQQPQENCSSAQPVKRTRASRTSANASKNLLKKL